jgi:hypothetical protein
MSVAKLMKKSPAGFIISFLFSFMDAVVYFFFKYFPHSLQKSTNCAVVVMTFFVDRKSIGFILHHRQLQQLEAHTA